MSFDVLSTSLIFWEVLSFLILLSLFLLGFSAVRRRWGSGEPGARETVDRRYANGEITRGEHLTIRDYITGNNDA
jgi:uncharacterized membrane protein